MNIIVKIHGYAHCQASKYQWILCGSQGFMTPKLQGQSLRTKVLIASCKSCCQLYLSCVLCILQTECYYWLKVLNFDWLRREHQFLIVFVDGQQKTMHISIMFVKLLHVIVQHIAMYTQSISMYMYLPMDIDCVYSTIYHNTHHLSVFFCVLITTCTKFSQPYSPCCHPVLQCGHAVMKS